MPCGTRIGRTPQPCGLDPRLSSPTMPRRFRHQRHGSCMSSAKTDLAAEIEDLVLANHILHAEGVVDSFGHVSFRSPERPDRFFMARAMAPSRVTAGDIMEFDMDGEPLDRRGRSVYSERFIHTEIYKKRADVNSVIHSHSPGVIPFSVTDVPLRAIMPPAG